MKKLPETSSRPWEVILLFLGVMAFWGALLAWSLR